MFLNYNIILNFKFFLFYFIARQIVHIYKLTEKEKKKSSQFRSCHAPAEQAVTSLERTRGIAQNTAESVWSLWTTGPRVDVGTLCRRPCHLHPFYE